MAAVSVPQSQQLRALRAPADVAAQIHELAPGQAHSLRPAAAMQLRVLRGRAWVTLGAGSAGWLAESGDLLLHAGQGARVPAGAHAVVEPLGGEALRYQWRSSAAAGAGAVRAGAAPACAQPHGA